MRQKASALGRSDLDSFLYSDIGRETNGMPLSVISAMARRGIDPWHEAERLAELPRLDATDRLAELIETMPHSVWQMPEAKVIAVRLAALLPHRPGSAFKSQLFSASVRNGMTRPMWPLLTIAIVIVGVMVAGTAYLAPAASKTAAPQPVAFQPQRASPAAH